eukprot:TRINITY_DN40353_c0_g1_i1.p1 TRINITY_DN40353_c0_g1~~TRINITY_DN40353_c0_g1_i1.p1  ORF type:complete len:381 (-),score=76.60 TRINITY_DN40353_c0_g1_i1:175-1317(-)
MADTAHATKEEMEELYDDDLVDKAKQMAAWIKESKHFVAFTGAGISTACGIPDFRGPTGVWTLRAKGETRKGPTTSSSKAIPSYTHMALVELANRGYLKYLISQNCDGLHRKSNFDPEKLSELHGNTNLERCTKCKRDYLRDFRVRNNGHVHKHETGRRCDDPKCRGPLVDTIVNFGENLPSRPLRRGIRNSEQADLYLVLGSSLRVTPAADMPAETPGKLVVCNLQRTPLDNRCAMRVHHKCDAFMRIIMDELGLTPPPFKLRRHVAISIEHKKHGGDNVLLETQDLAGNPFTFLNKLVVSKGASLPSEKLTAGPKYRTVVPTSSRDKKINCELHFMGHYHEPVYQFQYDANRGEEVQLLLAYDPTTRQWEQEPIESEE